MKVLFVATVVKSHINVFHIPYLKMFKEMGWETTVCARNDFEDPNECVIPYCDKYYDMPFERFPIKLNNLKVYKELKKLIETEKYNIIHCHTPTGGVLARLAAKNQRKNGTRVIYTAHGFHFFKGAPIVNWLLFYPVEKYCSNFTDTLITINKEDYELAKKKMKAKQIEYIPGIGVDIDKFSTLQINKFEKRKELGMSDDSIVILSVGELNKNKNHITVIEALKNSNDNIHYVIAGRGIYENILIKKAKEFGINDRVHLIGFRNDIAEIYKIADIFVFPSYREGLSVALMEAMANKLPVVCSRIRGNIELINENKGGFLCTSSDSSEFAERINELAVNKELRNRFGKYNAEKIKQFSIDNVMKTMKRIYSEVVEKNNV